MGSILCCSRRRFANGAGWRVGLSKYLGDGIIWAMHCEAFIVLGIEGLHMGISGFPKRPYICSTFEYMFCCSEFYTLHSGFFNRLIRLCRPALDTAPTYSSLLTSVTRKGVRSTLLASTGRITRRGIVQEDKLPLGVVRIQGQVRSKMSLQTRNI